MPFVIVLNILSDGCLILSTRSIKFYIFSCKDFSFNLRKGIAGEFLKEWIKLQNLLATMVGLNKRFVLIQLKRSNMAHFK